MTKHGTGTAQPHTCTICYLYRGRGKKDLQEHKNKKHFRPNVILAVQQQIPTSIEQSTNLEKESIEFWDWYDNESTQEQKGAIDRLVIPLTGYTIQSLREKTQ